MPYPTDSTLPYPSLAKPPVALAGGGGGRQWLLGFMPLYIMPHYKQWATQSKIPESPIDYNVYYVK